MKPTDGLSPSTADPTGLWHTVRGTGEPMVMLHPGGVDSRALDPIVDQLADRYRVFTPDQRGHGHTPDITGPMSFEDMAADTALFIERTIGTPVQLVGFSDGAIVALLVSLRRPDLVKNLVFAAGVYHRDGWLDGVLDGAPPAFLRELYGEVSPDGPEHYDDIVDKLDRMHEREPDLAPAQLAGVTCPCLVLAGDDDEMSLEHTISLYRALSRGELAIVPHASHGVLVEKPELCAKIISDFLAPEKPGTFAPIRRKFPR